MLRKRGRPAAIVAAAAKLIESAGANGFSLRKLAKALGVGPTAIHFHFEGGVWRGRPAGAGRRHPASAC